MSCSVISSVLALDLPICNGEIPALLWSIGRKWLRLAMSTRHDRRRHLMGKRKSKQSVCLNTGQRCERTVNWLWPCKDKGSTRRLLASLIVRSGFSVSFYDEKRRLGHTFYQASSIS